MVGITSARIARRRLRYETWYFLHLYTYIAIALSFSHQLATGNEFITHPANRALWAALYVVTFGLLLRLPGGGSGPRRLPLPVAGGGDSVPRAPTRCRCM